MQLKHLKSLLRRLGLFSAFGSGFIVGWTGCYLSCYLVAKRIAFELEQAEPLRVTVD